jgi:hypothetical protein
MIADDTSDINYSSSGVEDSTSVTIKITWDKKKTITNKYFNVAYNAMRYLWYHQYTNMAIIATNIFNLKFIQDPMDILAIAFSYQNSTDRAILPSITTDLEGILFFRPKEDNIQDLQKNTPFNNVFYRYPIYFNPKVTIRGSFFEDATSIIEAKELFSKMEGIDNIDDIPSFMINNIKTVYEDYILMKHAYMQIKNELDKLKYAIDRRNPLLLSKDISTLDFNAVDSMGYNKYISINIQSKTNKAYFSEDEKIPTRVEKINNFIVNDVDFVETPIF